MVTHQLTGTHLHLSSYIIKKTISSFIIKGSSVDRMVIVLQQKGEVRWSNSGLDLVFLYESLNTMLEWLLQFGAEGVIDRLITIRVVK